MPKIIIFGAAGHIGRQMAHQLHDNGVRFIWPADSKADLSTLWGNASFSRCDG